MRFVCESCRAQYMINDEKVGPKGVKVRCRKCGYVIHVKRTDGAAGAAPSRNTPVATSNDPDDALATQVMNSPLAASQEAALDTTSPGSVAVAEPPTSRVNMNDPAVQAAMEAKAAKTAARKNGAEAEAAAAEPKPGDSFLGADEDEIGAVFDSVLAGGATGPTSLPAGSLDSKPLGEGDRESTKVLDADMVRKLAEESTNGGAAPAPAPAKVEEIPQTDWYVALNDKQTGPLSLDQIKDHWDKGEVGPDSLCWRAGFTDWIPVSDVKALASVLAPKPAKPIVVAPAATVNPGMMGPSVVSVPVQSAFSAGGVVTTVQSEVHVPIAAAGVPSSGMGVVEDTGSWRPSAASALASLVKEEMEVLAKPAPRKSEPEDFGGGLLDLPTTAEERVAPAHSDAPVLRAAAPAPAPVNPYMANPGATYSAPAVTQYRPPSNRGLLIGLGVGGAVLLLCLVGLVLFLAFREPRVVVAQPPVVPPPVAVVAPPVAPTPAVPVAPVAVAPTPTPTPTPTPVAVAVAEKPAEAKQPEAVAAAPVRKQPTTTTRPVREKAEPPAPEEKKTVSSSKGSSEEGDFDALFGGGQKGKPKEEKAAAPEEKKKPGGYIPAAPGSGGGGDVKESLGQSDILEVVSSNKGALVKCGEEQRKREPGTSGRLVMKWTIQTSGKVTNVGVVTEEFKGTYMAGCVGGVIKAMGFPRHKKQGEPVQFPFKF